MDLNRDILQKNSAIAEDLCKCILKEMEQRVQDNAASYGNFLDIMKRDGVDTTKVVLLDVKNKSEEERNWKETIKSVTDVLGKLENVMQFSFILLQKNIKLSQSDINLAKKVLKKMHELAREMHEELISLNRSSDTEAAVNFNMDHIRKMEEDVDSFLDLLRIVRENVREQTNAFKSVLNDMGDTIDSCENVLTGAQSDLLKNVLTNMRINLQKAFISFMQVLFRVQIDVRDYRDVLKRQESKRGTHYLDQMQLDEVHFE